MCFSFRFIIRMFRLYSVSVFFLYTPSTIYDLVKAETRTNMLKFVLALPFGISSRSCLHRQAVVRGRMRLCLCVFLYSLVLRQTQVAPKRWSLRSNGVTAHNPGMHPNTPERLGETNSRLTRNGFYCIPGLLYLCTAAH